MALGVGHAHQLICRIPAVARRIGVAGDDLPLEGDVAVRVVAPSGGSGGIDHLGQPADRVRTGAPSLDTSVQ